MCCRVIVYPNPTMTQRASKFRCSRDTAYAAYVYVRAEFLDPDDFSSFHSPIIDYYGGYFLRVELTEPSRDRHCDSWPRGEINCVVQIPITTAESFGDSARVRIGPLQRRPAKSKTDSIQDRSGKLTVLWFLCLPCAPRAISIQFPIVNAIPRYFITDIVDIATSFCSSEFFSIINVEIVC